MLVEVNLGESIIHRLEKVDKFIQQECIPVGCILPAAVAIGGSASVHAGIDPLGVGLETPPSQIPFNFPLGCGPGDPPWPDPLQLPPGCGPGNLQGMLGYPPETCCKAC